MWNRIRVARRHFVGKVVRFVDNCSLEEVSDELPIGTDSFKESQLIVSEIYLDPRL